MTWACGSYPSPPPSSYWRSSCDAMSVPAQSLLRIDLSMTGGNCWATAQRSPPCSIACCIMATCLNAAHAVGAQKQACHHSRRQDRTTYVLDGLQSMAGCELIMYGRFSGDH